MTPSTPDSGLQQRWSPGVGRALGGAVLMAAASTLADAVWAIWIPRHRAVYGLIHGTALFLVFGLYLGFLGRSTRSFLVGLLGGPAAGLAAAGSFYLLARFFRYAAMFVSWPFLWILLAVLVRFVLRSGELWGHTLARGLAAAAFSGLAFYGISDIWLRPEPGGPHYLYHFLCWTLAFLPGFLALLLGRSSPASSPVR